MFPHALVIGEESAAQGPEMRRKIAEAEMAVIVAPVDGTWNFAHGLPLFGADRPLSVSRGGKSLSDLSGYIHLYLLPKDKQAAMAECLPDFARTLILRC